MERSREVGGADPGSEGPLEEAPVLVAEVLVQGVPGAVAETAVEELAREVADVTLAGMEEAADVLVAEVPLEELSVVVPVPIDLIVTAGTSSAEARAPEQLPAEVQVPAQEEVVQEDDVVQLLEVIPQAGAPGAEISAAEAAVSVAHDPRAEEAADVGFPMFAQVPAVVVQGPAHEELILGAAGVHEPDDDVDPHLLGAAGPAGGPVNSPKRAKCYICNEPAGLSCGSCKKVSYCGVKHQKEDWSRHEPTCPAFLIVDHPTLGKQWIAARTVRAGKVLIDEVPVVFSAPFDNANVRSMANAPCMTCATMKRTTKSLMRCPRCTWPICSKACATHPMHAANECRLFARKGITFPAHPDLFGSYTFGDVMIIVRAAMLKQLDPDKYKELLTLQSQESIPPSEQHRGFKKSLATKFRHLLAEEDEPRISDEELQKLIRVVILNRVTQERHETSRDALNMPFGATPFPLVSVVGQSFSRLNHSCAPNCHWEIRHAPPFEIHVQTAIRIKAGQELTIVYNNTACREETRIRQKVFQSGFGGFACQCRRCADPTELGTYMSALNCDVCLEARRNASTVVAAAMDTGYLIPQDPSDLSDSAVWKCNICPFSKRVRQFWPRLMEIQELITARDRIYAPHEPIDVGLIQHCQGIVWNYSDKLLHPNHWIIQRADEAIVHHFSSSRERLKVMNRPTCDVFMNHAGHLLSIEDVINPGVSKNRVALQVGITRVIKVLFRNHRRSMTLEEVRQHLEICIRMQEQSLLLFRADAPERPNQQLSGRALEMDNALNDSRAALVTIKAVIVASRAGDEGAAAN